MPSSATAATNAPPNRVLRLSALVLVLAVLPLAIIAAASLGQRVGQYGWTPERIWGAVAVTVALVYGALGWWAVAKRRAQFDEALRPLQVQLAIGLCATPSCSPCRSSISARFRPIRKSHAGVGSNGARQVRLEGDGVRFRPGGTAAAARDRTQRLARPASARRRGAGDQGPLQGRDRIEARQSESKLATQMRVVPTGAALSPELRLAVAHTRFCRVARCVLVMAGPDRTIVAGR